MRALTARPTCARCARPVDRFEETEHFGKLRLTATCHGERESVDLEPGEASGLRFSAAFAHAPLLTPAPALPAPPPARA